MEREFEEKRATVHAECERVCRYVNDAHRVNDEVELRRVTKRGDGGEWVLFLMGVEAPVAFGATSARAATRLYYSLLGLEARDAVEAERVKFDVDFQMLKNQILQSDDSIKLRDDLLKASESRAAKLVEALGEIRKPATIIGFGKKATGKMRAQQLEEDHVRVRTIANAAIAAHKEGGVQ